MHSIIKRDLGFWRRGVKQMQRIAWEELNPIVNYANTLKCEPGFQFGPRTISNHQFIYVAKGRGSAEIEKREYHAEKGALFYYGPGVIHTFIADQSDPFELYGVHFTWHAELAAVKDLQSIIDVSRRATSATSLQNLIVIGDKGLDELKLGDYMNVLGTGIADLLLDIIKQFRNDSEKSAVANRGLLLHLLLLLHRHTHTVAPTFSPFVKLLFDVKAKLETAAMASYSRKWLSEWSGYNEDYLSRCFHEQFGIPPHQYHLLQKISKAKELLEHTDYSASLIAEKLNLSSVHYFCRLFKNQTTYTPLGYRKMCRMV
jgi:AraC-like DNA-binding protein